jgi:hypothetical protein
MDEPIDTAAVAGHLKATQGLGSIDVPSAYHSNWLDNTRVKFVSPDTKPFGDGRGLSEEPRRTRTPASAPRESDKTRRQPAQAIVSQGASSRNGPREIALLSGLFAGRRPNQIRPIERV